LEPLADDPDPTTRHEAEYGGKNMDPATLSINTVRGEAMHAAVRYGLWVRRHVPLSEDHTTTIRGFSEMPELRVLLDQRLRHEAEPSQTVRAVFGWWLPWLALLDREWVAANLTAIFPLEPNYRHLLDAAWDTYITICQPFDDILPLLEGEYIRAIERIGSERNIRHGETPDERLAEHLMVFYLRGKLGLESTQISAFFERAPDLLRAHAIAFVGRVLLNADNLPSDFICRARTLWERRIATARAAPQSPAAELEAFGWWFGSDRFDTEWSTANLRDALSLVGRSEPDHLVLERLVTISKDLPGICAECVRMLVEGAKEQWTVYMWRDELRSILQNVMSSTSSSAREVAERVINLLAARGYPEFRDILTSRFPSPDTANELH